MTVACPIVIDIITNFSQWVIKDPTQLSSITFTADLNPLTQTIMPLTTLVVNKKIQF
jgi:hypothetical protein